MLRGEQHLFLDRFDEVGVGAGDQPIGLRRPVDVDRRALDHRNLLGQWVELERGRDLEAADVGEADVDDRDVGKLLASWRPSRRRRPRPRPCRPASANRGGTVGCPRCRRRRVPPRPGARRIASDRAISRSGASHTSSTACAGRRLTGSGMTGPYATGAALTTGGGVPRSRRLGPQAATLRSRVRRRFGDGAQRVGGRETEWSQHGHLADSALEDVAGRAGGRDVCGRARRVPGQRSGSIIASDTIVRS